MFEEKMGFWPRRRTEGEAGLRRVGALCAARLQPTNKGPFDGQSMIKSITAKAMELHRIS